MNRFNGNERTLLVAAAVAVLVGTAAAQTGTFTDSRDKQTYKTVAIGKQNWMAQNLNYQPQTGNSWCYGNDNSKCNEYGRLYDWKTANTVCMSGWHLPSRQEWSNLVATAGGDKKAGKKLKAIIGWNKKGNGTDNFGFSALPGGYRYPMAVSTMPATTATGGRLRRTVITTPTSGACTTTATTWTRTTTISTADVLCVAFRNNYRANTNPRPVDPSPTADTAVHAGNHPVPAADILYLFCIKEAVDMNEKAKSELNRIVDTLAGTGIVSKIILFGSYAKGEETPRSDIDLCVLTTVTDRRPLDVSIDLQQKLFYVADTSLDLFAYNQDEFSARAKCPGTFQNDIIKHGVVLYE